MTVAIRALKLGKRYRVSHQGMRPRYRTLRETLAGLVRTPLRRWGGTPTEEFWALKDIDFEVQPGEALAVIGRNGAGKSTLLKILSRITKPTTGEVHLVGRVGSLLEVGTGFHPELTGRENVFLSGSILGMSRREIQRRFDEIVAFAEVEPFLDTPVKRYSSGMYVRLAFAVAAHLDPEILLVDEVLAVGDAAFQRRCIARMAELARGGRSLLFVSHNLDLIPRFCRRAILLEKGTLKRNGNALEVIAAYLTDLLGSAGAGILTGRHRRGSGEARFTALRFLDPRGRELDVIHSGQDLRCVLDIEAVKPIPAVSLAIAIKTLQGTRLLTSWTDEVGYPTNLRAGVQRFECRFEKVRLRPGRPVALDLWLHGTDLLDHLEDARVLDVIELTPTGYSNRQDQGCVLCDYTWTQHDLDPVAPAGSG